MKRLRDWWATRDRAATFGLEVAAYGLVVYVAVLLLARR